MKKRRRFEPIPVEELAAMPTKQLLGLRDGLLRLEESPDASDMYPDEIDPDVIQFKSDPRWASTYAALKAALAGREHVPGGEERAARRRARGRRGAAR